MRLERNLREMERGREAYWLRYPATSPVKLRWRALAVRHCFHVLPGESLLELGAGSGLWTEHLATVLRGEARITAAVFNDDLRERASQKKLPNTTFVSVSDLANDLPVESFDFVVGTAILCHEAYALNLKAIHRLLKPGGQLLFFEANFWNPQVLLKGAVRAIRRWAGHPSYQVGMRKYKLMRMASQAGFTHVEIIPYDILHPMLPRSLIRFVQSVTFVLEHTPVIRELCGTLYIWARKPADGEAQRPHVSLARHRELFDSTSVVVPCHNEEMNVPPLIDALVQFYGDYIHEVIIVNDNSTDRTAEVTREVARKYPCVRLVDRQPPNGVGLALRDGYAAAAGRYILTMDCDFLQIVPELRDLFDAIAAGRDGAIGSRFSHESMLINYPVFKILCNRIFHLLVKLLLFWRVRDISNNLKLYRAEILKDLEIEERHFAANVETGLKPLLAGYDIEEVPISWINRTVEMGSSSFRIVKVAPNYLGVLARAVWNAWWGRRRHPKPAASSVLRLKTPRSRVATPFRPCPLCGSTDVTLCREGQDHELRPAGLGPSRTEVSPGRILRCRSCRAGFRAAAPSEEMLARLYHGLDSTVYERELRARSKTALRQLRIVGRYVAPGALLDVGCGSGGFLRCAADAGWKVVGIEPGEAPHQSARALLAGRGEVIRATLQEVSLAHSSFDAVTLWDVLEHAPDPLALMRRSTPLLRPGGYLFVNVPDLDSLPARILGSRWPLLLPEHLTYFGRKSLRLCGEQSDLELLRFGRRLVSFSIGYVLHRLAQHSVPGAATTAGLAHRLGLDDIVIPVPLGELYGVWRRPGHRLAERTDDVERGGRRT